MRFGLAQNRLHLCPDRFDRALARFGDVARRGAGHQRACDFAFGLAEPEGLAQHGANAIVPGKVGNAEKAERGLAVARGRPRQRDDEGRTVAGRKGARHRQQSARRLGAHPRQRLADLAHAVGIDGQRGERLSGGGAEKLGRGAIGRDDSPAAAEQHGGPGIGLDQRLDRTPVLKRPAETFENGEGIEKVPLDLITVGGRPPGGFGPVEFADGIGDVPLPGGHQFVVAAGLEHGRIDLIDQPCGRGTRRLSVVARGRHYPPPHRSQ